MLTFINRQLISHIILRGLYNCFFKATFCMLYGIILLLLLVNIVNIPKRKKNEELVFELIILLLEGRSSGVSGKVSVLRVLA